MELMGTTGGPVLSLHCRQPRVCQEGVCFQLFLFYSKTNNPNPNFPQALSARAGMRAQSCSHRSTAGSDQPILQCLSIPQLCFFWPWRSSASRHPAGLFAALSVKDKSAEVC